MRAVLTDLGVAACLIKNEAILLVKEASGPQKGRWGMPKGTVDEGELPSFAALRELEEECGISGTIKKMIGVRECLIRNIPAIFIVYLVDYDSADVTIDNDEIEDYGWFELNGFESIDWISSAMRELATAALSDVDKEMIDYTEERGQEYFLYL